MTGEPEIAALFFAVLAVAFLYSTVGHGGATGYLAAGALIGFAPRELRGLALALNILVAGLSWLAYQRAGHFKASKFLPLVWTSVPAAWLGARYKVSDRALGLLLGAALLASALRFFILNKPLRESPPGSKLRVRLGLPLLGASLGFLSGVTGIGGGVYLSPLLLALGWADAKGTAALSSGFIVVNSLAGLMALSPENRPALALLGPMAAAAWAGALLGSRWGAGRLSPLGLQRLLALVLFAASGKLLAGALG